METRFKFVGDVGQVIGGSATFTAPHTFHQVNNVTLNTQIAEQQLSMRQRAHFAKRVEDVAEAEGIKPDAVYRILLEDYGGQSSRDTRRLPFLSLRWVVPICTSITLAGIVLATGNLPDDEPPPHCRWDGKEFSVGAVSNMGTRDVYECIHDPDAHTHPYWVPGRSLGAAGTTRAG